MCAWRGRTTTASFLFRLRAGRFYWGRQTRLRGALLSGLTAKFGSTWMAARMARNSACDHMRAAVFVILTTIGLLAGCTERQPAMESEGPNSNSAILSSSPPMVLPTSMELPPSFSLVNCAGIKAASTLPKTIAGAMPPVGWAESESQVVEAWVFVLDCARLSWGPFERPVRLLLEFHGNANVPVSCQRGGVESLDVLTQLWISDGELLPLFSQAFGFEARLAQIDAVGTNELRAWEFGLPNGEQSYLQSKSRTSDLDAHDVTLGRVFWTNELGGISYSNLLSDLVYDSVGQPLVTGNLEAPFLFSNSDFPVFVGLGDAYSEGTVEVALETFGDKTCEQPLL